MTGPAGLFRAVEHTDDGAVPLGTVEMAPDGTLHRLQEDASALAAAVADANQLDVLHAEVSAPDGAPPGQPYAQVIPRGDPAFPGRLLVHLRTYYGIELVPH